MKLEDIRNISVIGAGIMGHGIALTYAMSGYQVRLNDISNSILKKALHFIRTDLGTLAENGFISREEIDSTLSRITTTINLGKAVFDTDFVTEAVVEDIEVKKKLFNQLDVLCPPRTILASNSSSLLISDFASGTERQDRIILTHWFNPPHIVPIVEIIKGQKTANETVNLVYALLKKAGKLPIRISKEIPGYLVNRIQMAMMREAWDLWEQGIASSEDIDLAVKGSLGFRLASIGPLLTSDLGGLDTWYRIAKYLLPLISDSQEPPMIIRKMVEAGELGMKTGKGIFNYSLDEWDRITKQRDRDFLERFKMLYCSKR